jgi:hypothetical protein
MDMDGDNSLLMGFQFGSQSLRIKMIVDAALKAAASGCISQAARL